MACMTKKLDTEAYSSQAIVVDVTLAATATSQQVRAGQPVEQTLERVSTAKLITGAQLHHRVDGQRYEVVDVIKDSTKQFRIRRVSDQAEFDASLPELKRCTWLVTYKPGS